MNPLLAAIVFVVVLFIYIHIYHNVKVSNDLEVYEVDNPSKDRLEEICDIRQPAIFSIDNEELNNTMTREFVNGRYSAFDVNLRDTSRNNEQTNTSSTTDAPKQLYVPLALGAVTDMLTTGKATGIFSEKNSEFLVETGLINHMKHNDAILRPHMVSKCDYDWLIGSADTTTPFRYELNYRTYFVVTEGKARIKLAPPKSGKYLNIDKDYINFEFRSKVDPWEPQAQYKGDFSKVKCLEVELSMGQVFYVPAYWFYSIKFDDGTSLCKFSYQTYMGSLSIIHYHTLAFLQRNNTRNKVAKSLENEPPPSSSSIQPDTNVNIDTVTNTNVLPDGNE